MAQINKLKDIRRTIIAKLKQLDYKELPLNRTDFNLWVVNQLPNDDLRIIRAVAGEDEDALQDWVLELLLESERYLRFDNNGTEDVKPAPPSSKR
jgi:hypothetical protein